MRTACICRDICVNNKIMRDLVKLKDGYVSVQDIPR